MSTLYHRSSATSATSSILPSAAAAVSSFAFYCATALLLVLVSCSIPSADAFLTGSSAMSNGTVDTVLHSTFANSMKLSRVACSDLATRYAAGGATPPSFHLHLFEPLPAPAASTGVAYAELPLLAAPLCVAYNFADSGIELEFAMTTLAAWIMGTDSGAVISAPGSSSTVTTFAATLVLAANSPSTRVVLNAFVAHGMTGFTSETTLPASVLANSSIMFVADDAAVASTLQSTPGTVGFVPLAGGHGLRCASVRVDYHVHHHEHSLTPFLHDATSRSTSLVLRENNNTINTDVRSSGAEPQYPFIGVLLLAVPRLVNDDFSDCRHIAQHSDIARFVIRTFVSSTTAADSSAHSASAAGSSDSSSTSASIQQLLSLAPLFAQWGFARFSPFQRMHILKRLLHDDPSLLLGPAPSCSSVTYVRAGGGSAISTMIGDLALSFLSHETSAVVVYDPKGSSAGLSALKQRTKRFVSSESLLSAEDRKDFPHIALVPGVAWTLSIVFNLPGANEKLTLPICVVPAIFNGSITSWNDPRLVAANPLVKLPAETIKIVTRSADSGTVETFTESLLQIETACTGAPRSLPGGATSTWPAAWPSAVAAALTNDVVTAVKNTAYSISIAPTATARAYDAPSANIINTTTSEVVQPLSEFASRALDVAVVNASTSQVVFSPSSTSANAAAVWPFIAMTYFAFHLETDTAANCSEEREALMFVMWMQSDTAARSIASEMGYVPLTAKFVDANRKLIEGSARCAGNLLFPPRAHGSDDARTIAIALGVTSGVLVLLLIGVILLSLYYASKRNAAGAGADSSAEFAPKDKSKAVTVVFCGVQSSAALWALAPTKMPLAVDLYDRIVRQALVKHRGHEARRFQTEQFMCVFERAADALFFALDVQEQLNETCDCPAITEAYNKMLQQGLLYPKKSSSSSGGGARGGGGSSAASQSPLASSVNSGADSQQKLQVDNKNVSGGTDHSGGGSSTTTSTTGVLSTSARPHNHHHPTVNSSNSDGNNTNSSNSGNSGSSSNSSTQLRIVEATSARRDRRSFNGLSVRIGMHTGLCDDIIASSAPHTVVEYVGHVVGTALALTNAAWGGQIVCSAAFHEAAGLELSSSGGGGAAAAASQQQKDAFEFVPLGPENSLVETHAAVAATAGEDNNTPRTTTVTTDLVEVRCARGPLARRVFPPLRTALRLLSDDNDFNKVGSASSVFALVSQELSSSSAAGRRVPAVSGALGGGGGGAAASASALDRVGTDQEVAIELQRSINTNSHAIPSSNKKPQSLHLGASAVTDAFFGFSASLSDDGDDDDKNDNSGGFFSDDVPAGLGAIHELTPASSQTQPQPPRYDDRYSAGGESQGSIVPINNNNNNSNTPSILGAASRAGDADSVISTSTAMTALWGKNGHEGRRANSSKFRHSEQQLASLLRVGDLTDNKLNSAADGSSEADDTRRLLQIATHLRIVLATSPTPQDRKLLLTTLLKNWRVEEVRSALHKELRDELGSERYWLMRLAARVAAVVAVHDLREREEQARQRERAAAAADDETPTRRKLAQQDNNYENNQSPTYGSSAGPGTPDLLPHSTTTPQ